MILSNTKIWDALDTGRLIIKPQPRPRLEDIGQKSPYDTSSVDLTLDPEISVPNPGPFTYDLTQPGRLAEFIGRNSEKIITTSKSPFLLEHGQFVLAQTREEIELPIPEDGETCLAARIEGKSSRARCGILIHFTAPTVHPGFTGKLALEMINLGTATFVLRPGMAIAQLIVEEVAGLPVSNPSQFQGQTSPEGL